MHLQDRGRHLRSYRAEKRLLHDFRLVRGAHQTKLVFDLAVPYSMETPYKELKEQIDAGLKEKGMEYETVVHFDGKA